MVLRVRTNWTGIHGSPLLSTHYFSEVAGSAQDAVDYLSSFWTACNSIINDDATWTTDPTVSEFDTATGALVANHATSGNTDHGDDNGGPLPWATQGSITWVTTGFSGNRIIKGRTFIPGPTRSRDTDGHPDSTYVSTLGTAGGDLIGGIAGFFGVWSQTHGVFFAAESCSPLGSEWAVLRSRRT